jgi:ABC-type nickel/cobalt efflux system permease component RcnA
MTTQRLNYHITLICLMLGCLMLFSFVGIRGMGVESQQKSPFGVSAPTAPIPVAGGFLRENLGWIYQQQAAFYQKLTAAVKDAKDSGRAVLFLTGLSFLYGIFHAAGPGHGKIVISSYVLANEQSAKRGMIISFIAAFMQGLVAVLFIGMAVFLLSSTSFAITEATYWLERFSYTLIALLGVFLLWQKGAQPFLLAKAASTAQTQHQHGLVQSSHQHHCADAHAEHSGHDHTHHGHHHHDHSCSCGGHAVDPDIMKEPLSFKSAWAAIVSVGVRPCSGALIVLVFASAQGLFWIGVASTFAMALGTAITVTCLATIALGAKGLATRYLSATGSSGLVFKSVEVLGASLVFFFGITLLAASLQA